jgi:hypothetical protein
MKKLLFLLPATYLCACTFPITPGEGNLLAGTKQFQPELFNYGARGVVIASMTDNVSDDGFFGKEYDDVMAFKNIKTGEVYSLTTHIGDNEFDYAMLPIGEYQITNLYLQYVYTTTQQIGNTTQTTTHIETVEHFENDKIITFNVLPGTVSYIGNIELVQSDNTVSNDGRVSGNSFNITDKSAEISDAQKSEWMDEFGKNYIVKTATVK